MSKSSLFKWALLTGGTGLLFAACTVGSGDGISKNPHGSGAAGGSDGNDTGGAGDQTSTGGADTTPGGGTATGATGAMDGGGADNMGGSTSAPLACDGETSDTTTSCLDLDPDSDNSCEACIKTSCCTQYEACLGEGPDQACAWGGPGDNGEFYCVQDCMQAIAQSGDFGEDDLENCAGECLTESCDLPNVTDVTNDMITCVNNECFDDCFDVQ